MIVFACACVRALTLYMYTYLCIICICVCILFERPVRMFTRCGYVFACGVICQFGTGVAGVLVYPPAYGIAYMRKCILCISICIYTYTCVCVRVCVYTKLFPILQRYSRPYHILQPCATQKNALYNTQQTLYYTKRALHYTKKTKCAKSPREPCATPKKPSPIRQESCIVGLHQKSPVHYAKSLILYAKSPILCQKPGIIYEKSPI